MHWEFHDVDNLAALQRLAERTAALVQEAPDASIKHDLAFLASKLGAPGTRLKICLLTDSARVDGLACFVDEPNKLVFSLGPVTLLRLSVRRLVINVAPLLSARLNAEDCESQSALLANTICQGLQAKGGGTAPGRRSVEPADEVRHPRDPVEHETRISCCAAWQKPAALASHDGTIVR